MKQQQTLRVRWHRISQKSAGYLLILPAFALILLIAVYPVVRSFWISLYDVRLNDPAKSDIHSTYSVDMERYFGTVLVLDNTLQREIGAAEGAIKEEIQGVAGNLRSIQALLLNEGDVGSRHEAVNQLLNEFKPVPNELKYAGVDNHAAGEARALLAETKEHIARLEAEDTLQRPKDLLGMLTSLEESFITPNYVGLAHYRHYLTDSRMWAALGNTVLFTVLSVSIEFALGLAIALLINQSFKGRGAVRASILIPWATPTAISGMIWSYLYDGQSGILSRWLTNLGLLADMGQLLATKTGAFTGIIAADVWKTSPFIALLLFAGLQTIPVSLYEAAEVDGASRWQQFRKITLPLLKSAALVALLFRTLDAFRVFDLIYVLTGGGPANSTESISMYAYKTMFAQLNFGAGSALSVIVFICIAVICMGYIRILGADLIARRGGR